MQFPNVQENSRLPLSLAHNATKDTGRRLISEMKHEQRMFVMRVFCFNSVTCFLTNVLLLTFYVTVLYGYHFKLKYLPKSLDTIVSISFDSLPVHLSSRSLIPPSIYILTSTYVCASNLCDNIVCG